VRNAYYTQLQNPLGLAIVDLTCMSGKLWEVNRINTPRLHRERGVARELMRQVTHDADAEGATLRLLINPSDGLQWQDLVLWYMRLGFEQVPTGYWVRQPKKVDSA